MNKSNRSGFTLVELIFVIVIIGVLAAVAVPKFAGLKQNAEASSVIKVAKDAFASIPSAYVNQVDLEGKTITDITQLVSINGQNWTTSALVATYNDKGTAGTDDVITLTVDDTARNVVLIIDCDNFTDASTQTKCLEKTGMVSGTPIDTNTSF